MASAVVAAGATGAHLAVLYWVEGGLPTGVAVAVYGLRSAKRRTNRVKEAMIAPLEADSP